jgi:hypothetical protein
VYKNLQTISNPYIMPGCTVNYRNEFLGWVQILLVSATRNRVPDRRCIQRRIQFLGLKKTGRRGRLGAPFSTIAEVPRPKSLQLGKGDCLKIGYPIPSIGSSMLIIIVPT